MSSVYWHGLTVPGLSWGVCLALALLRRRRICPGNTHHITVVKADLRDSGLSGELPLLLRIKDLLRGGAKTVKEIAEVLEANEATTRTAINRMSNKGYLIKVGESWGLKQEL